MTSPQPEPTFIYQYGMGWVEASDINDFIERWHADFTQSAMTLSEYLGLSPAEYARWFNTGELPPR
jgi:hypothetical protein